MRRAVFLILFQCVVLLSFLFAQEVIPWNECIKRVLINSPAIKRAKYDIEDVHFEKNLAYGEYLPALSLSSSSKRNIQGPREVWLGAEPHRQKGDAYNFHSLSINLSYLIFDWGNSMRKYSYYTRSEKAKKAAFLATKRKVIINTYNLYCQLLEAREILQFYKDEYKNLKKQEKIIAGLVEPGLRSDVDLNRVRVQCGNISAKISTQNALIRKFTTELAIQMGLKEDQQFIPEPILLSINDLEDTTIVFVPQLLLSNPEIVQLHSQLEAERIQMDIQKWDFLPDIYFNSAYQRSDQQLEEVYGNFSNNWYFNISLNLYIPIYKNNHDRLKYEQIALKIQKLEESLREKRIAIFNELEELIFDLEALKNNYITYKSNVDYLQKICDYESEKYHSGTGEFLNLLQALQSLLEMKQALIKTKYAILRIVFNLNTCKGKLDQM